MQLIAMHGWCGDHRSWAPFEAQARERGWGWQSPDRGYGPCPPLAPAWPAQGRRVVLAHSLGPHLLPAELLHQAEAVVLLASFGRFVPLGPGGRRLRAALAGMARELQGPNPEAMLHAFLEKAAEPQPISRLPATILEAPLTAAGRQRLLEDLARLEATSGLPCGFPSQAPCLIVEAERDQIVLPQARQLLREALPEADRLELRGIGHCLLADSLVDQVIGWIEQL
ncbi:MULTISPECIES: alpha/beta fold hydrolase [Aphanothece]|uniref:alpha/beta fold hydrolase n=1 Tax=Aphanothece TaxID=1121 RepID=UPI003984AABC